MYQRKFPILGDIVLKTVTSQQPYFPVQKEGEKERIIATANKDVRSLLDVK